MTGAVRTRIGGRQKGTPNKARAELKQIALKALGREPIEELCALYQSATEDGIRLNALKEICSYCYPKPKAVELTGAGGEALFPAQPITQADRLELVGKARESAK